MYENIKFSIVVCIFNPNVVLLERLLTSISAILEATDELVEVILVDNNSSPPILNNHCVQNFVQKSPLIKCIVEKKQGLTFARCCAIAQVSAPIVVFFDDDNEPALNYLRILDDYFHRYPNVGVWGPGEITVEYTDPVEDWFREHPHEFQQRHRDFGFTCIPACWNKYCPNGTGFAVRREILKEFSLAVEKGELKATGRLGKKLSSAEDVQIVWEGVKLGFAVGMIPELKCNHLISADKASYAYLQRLHFGTASSYAPALIESFPDQYKQWQTPSSFVHIYTEILKYCVKIFLKPHIRKETQLKFSSRLGALYGSACIESPNRARHILFIAQRLAFI